MTTLLLKTMTVLLYIACALVPCKHALHMFQQNRYELKRYGAWTKENLNTLVHSDQSDLLFYIVMLVLGLIAGIFMKPLTVSFAIACAAFCAVKSINQERKKTYIKPLVYTGRVKRQIAVMAVLYALILIFLLDPLNSVSLWGVLALCLIGPWLMIYPVGWITAPIEHGVQQWYLNDAKKQLQNHTGLVTIGITGSYGKTSTKNVMQAVLSEQFNSLMTPASYNTPMGITRTIRQYLKPIHQVFVCEMGADKVGDITELMNLVHPSIGVVTSIGPQHLSTFGSQENIIKEKMQMIELLPEDGLGILNYDNEFIRNYHLVNPVHCVSYAIDYANADYRAEEIHYSISGSSFTLVHGAERIPFETKLLGKLNILNILSAIAASRYLNVAWPVIQRGVKQMKQVEHRLEQKQINGLHFIDDAFNANPSGAAMSLDVLSGMPKKRWIVTPGMIELGARQDEINHDFGAQMKNKADEVILVGRKQTEPIYAGLKDSQFDLDHVQVVDTVKEAFAYVYAHASKEDVILLENDLPDAFNH
ncbi:MAG: UDP-N-acetylmuramoyl-tripeptide--D-alanyl-D-alanine ligase [Solobacterium sp.]|jgi:UDP-N-acetylmuramoyl-tripeptide--D-alanyl-D-alanine ligase|nr:UDP-N-acetylmuramoyl-tripeptide--D-alanyl-D-alanine ligase [Solobacterium sp.]MCH4266729.1 UDP-N-acetylmuramoyl-tripeptide--D-alanyl-D-alanine ligase [Solobacterium sp.]